VRALARCLQPGCLQPGEERVEAGGESLVAVAGPYVLAKDSQDREPVRWQ